MLLKIWNKTLLGLLPVYALFGAPQSAAGQSPIIVVGESNNLSRSPQQRSLFPRVVAVDENAYAVWQEEGSGVAFAKLTDHGNTTVASHSFSANGGVFDKPDLAIAGQYVYLVWDEFTADLNERVLWMVISKDGGLTFAAPRRIVQTVPVGNRSTWRPRVAARGAEAWVLWCEGGTQPGLHVQSFMQGGDGPTYHQFLSPSSDCSATGFDNYAILAAGNETALHVYVASTKSGAIMVQRKLPGSLDFTPETMIGGFAPQSFTSPKLAAAGDDVSVVWNDGRPGYSLVTLAVSNNAGQSFSVMPLSDELNSCKYGRENTCWYSQYDLATADGTIYVVWQGVDGLFASHSASDGQNPATPVRIGDASTLSDLDVSASGTDLFVTWYGYTAPDRRNWDTYVAASRDHGVSFTLLNASQTSTLSFAPGVAAFADGSFLLVWSEVVDGTINGVGFEIFSALGSVADQDLAIVEQVSAVQAPLSSEIFAAGKPTAVRVAVQNGFPVKKTVTAQLLYNEGSTNKTILQSLTLSPGLNIRYLPPAGFRPTEYALSIDIKLDPFNRIVETNEANNTGSTVYGVQDTRPMRLLFVPIHVIGEPLNPTPQIVQLIRENAAEYLNQTFPIDDRESWYIAHPGSPLAIPARVTIGADWDSLTAQLIQLCKSGPYYKVIGILPSGWLAKYHLQPTWVGVAGKIVGIDRPCEYAFAEQGQSGSVIAHEIGHTMGLDHTNNVTAPGYRVTWGLSVNGLDFMNENVALTDVEWVSPATYDYIFEKMKREDQPLHLDAAPLQSQPQSLLISGVLRQDGQIDAAPWYQLNEAPDILFNQAGPLSLEYVDSHGVTLGQTAFDVAGAAAPISTASSLAQEAPTAGAFVVRAPVVPDTARLRIKRDGQLLLERIRTTNLQTVTVLTPNGGERYRVGEPITLTWSASDADGDDLHYLVSLSNDDGITWLPLATNQGEIQLVITTSTTLITNQARVRIIASDGINTAQAQSGAPFVIAPNRLNGKIAYECGEYFGSGEVCVMNVDGSEFAMITPDNSWQGGVPPFYGRKPTWSPDGQKILFTGGHDITSGHPNDFGIWVMNADGSNRRQIIPLLGGCHQWSNDGETILAVSRTVSTGGPELWQFSADGTNAHKLFDADGKLRIEACPHWSPDNTQLVFAASVQDATGIWQAPQIYKMQLDGNNFIPLTADAKEAIHPAWSPDGDLIVYGAEYDTWIIDSNGAVKVRIHDNPGPYTVLDTGADFEFSWSPDGTKIIFAHDPPGQGGLSAIWMMDADGGNMLQLTTERNQSWPVWQSLPGPTFDRVLPLSASAGSFYDGQEGSAIVLDGSQSKPGTAISYTWDLDSDGDYDDGVGVTTTITLANEGEYIVALQVSDATGQTATDLATMRVVNAPPILTATVLSVDAAGFAGLSATIIDPGREDILTATVAWGHDVSPQPLALIQEKGGYTVFATHSGLNEGDFVILTVTDDSGASVSATLTATLAATNQPPIMQAQRVTVTANLPTAITLQASDAELDPLVFAIVTPPSHGAVTVIEQNGALPGIAPNLVYHPAQDYAGTDSFMVKANDGRADSNQVTVQIQVLAATSRLYLPIISR